MPKFNIYRTAVDCITVEAESEEEALELAYEDDFSDATPCDTKWAVEEIP